MQQNPSRQAMPSHSAGDGLKPCKVNWGIGMIAMPFYLHTAGLEAGLLFFVLSMLLAWDAANVMHHLAQRLQETPERQAGSTVGWEKLQDLQAASALEVSCLD
jgi:hypothetical protein